MTPEAAHQKARDIIASAMTDPMMPGVNAEKLIAIRDENYKGIMRLVALIADEIIGEDEDPNELDPALRTAEYQRRSLRAAQRSRLAAYRKDI